ncbi:hypothetical protein LCGC14_1460260 [marine sediment metagenome]|uniref:Methyltransferase FkbM domain-containing protein n=1 Tax=marine sediment metagenome TaxID=412755 RepID=A0A0F9JFA2_9ZZZZ
MGNITKTHPRKIDIVNLLGKLVGTDSKIMLEIGACEGNDSNLFLRIFKNLKLFCFEADPDNCRDHRRIVKSSRCQLIDGAISDQDGTITFNRSGGIHPGVSKNRRSSGSVNKPTGHLNLHPWCTFEQSITIPSYTLDVWCKQNNITQIDLIWADVNGAETKMLVGGAEILKRTRYLYTEFGPEDMEIWAEGITKEQIKARLPQFEEIFVHSNNVLLKNTELNDV